MTHAAEKLEAKHETALAALLAHPTVAEAAKAAKVSQATLWRYMRDAKFSAHYAEARADVTKHLIMRLTSASTSAARVLLEVAEDTTAPASARVSAARTIIEQALRGAELRDLMERIEALETMQKEKS